MLKSNESANYQPFYSLLDGLENKEVALFVHGNTDPVIDSEVLKKKATFFAGMEDRGVRFLQTFDAVGEGVQGFILLILTITRTQCFQS